MSVAQIVFKKPQQGHYKSPVACSQAHVSDGEEQQSAKVKMKSNIYIHIYIDNCFIIIQTRISYDFQFKKKVLFLESINLISELMETCNLQSL